MRIGLTKALLLAVLPWSLTGCPSVAEAPDPPGVADLLAAYETPDGVLTTAVAATLVREADERLTRLADVAALIAVLVGALDTLAGVGGVEGGAVPLASAQAGIAVRRDPISLSSGGWVELERRCPGGADVEADRGQLALRAVVDDAGFNPVVWGEIDGCRALVGSEERRYDGDIRLYAPNLGRGGMLVAIAGTLTIDGATVRRIDVDARFADGLFLMRQEVEGQSFLLGGSAGDEAVRIVDAAGAWRCTLDGCTGPAGEVFSF